MPKSHIPRELDSPDVESDNTNVNETEMVVLAVVVTANSESLNQFWFQNC